MLTENAVCERCKGGRYFEAVRHQCLGQGAAVNMLAAFEMGMTKITQAYERTVGAFICPSAFMADTMNAWGEPPSKLRVLPNAVAVPEVLGLHDQPFYLAAGRLSAEKGLETLIRAVATLPHIHLKIAGIGPEEGRLRALVLQLKATNIEWLGFLRRSELQEIRSQARALVISSVWYENAPGAVLEAMADGMPVIASRIGGLPEMVEHGKTGFLATAGDVSAWKTALQDMWELSQAERMRMGAEARRRVEERYTWERHMEGLFQIYGDVGAPVDIERKNT
jgi:glycosyltransferase involved in cell wall biosynthesis